MSQPPFLCTVIASPLYRTMILATGRDASRIIFLFCIAESARGRASRTKKVTPLGVSEYFLMSRSGEGRGAFKRSPSPGLTHNHPITVPRRRERLNALGSAFGRHGVVSLERQPFSVFCQN
jgi:hypothetical protein